MDTASTYWETDTADALVELVDESGDDETSNPVQIGPRVCRHAGTTAPICRRW